MYGVTFLIPDSKLKRTQYLFHCIKTVKEKRLTAIQKNRHRTDKMSPVCDINCFYNWYLVIIRIIIKYI